MDCRKNPTRQDAGRGEGGEAAPFLPAQLQVILLCVNRMLRSPLNLGIDQESTCIYCIRLRCSYLRKGHVIDPQWHLGFIGLQQNLWFTKMDSDQVLGPTVHGLRAELLLRTQVLCWYSAEPRSMAIPQTSLPSCISWIGVGEERYHEVAQMPVAKEASRVLVPRGDSQLVPGLSCSSPSWRKSASPSRTCFPNLRIFLGSK